MAALTKTPRPELVPIVPLEYVADHARRVARMCDMLEAIADELPNKAKPFWNEVTQLCTTIIPRHYDEVTQLLMPVLRRRTKGAVECEAVLSRLQAEYWEERARLPELTELLTDAVGKDAHRLSADALGYALRGFFDAIRRQSQWETEVLLPLASRHLTQEDLDQLARELASSVTALPTLREVQHHGEQT